MFIVFNTAPIIGTPKCVSYISGVLKQRTATVSPFPIPLLESALASCLLLLYVSDHVNCFLPCIIEVLFG